MYVVEVRSNFQDSFHCFHPAGNKSSAEQVVQQEFEFWKRCFGRYGLRVRKELNQGNGLTITAVAVERNTNKTMFCTHIDVKEVKDVIDFGVLSLRSLKEVFVEEYSVLPRLKSICIIGRNDWCINSIKETKDVSNALKVDAEQYPYYLELSRSRFDPDFDSDVHASESNGLLDEEHRVFLNRNGIFMPESQPNRKSYFCWSDADADDLIRSIKKKVQKDHKGQHHLMTQKAAPIKEPLFFMY